MFSEVETSLEELEPDPVTEVIISISYCCYSVGYVGHCDGGGDKEEEDFQVSAHDRVKSFK